VYSGSNDRNLLVWTPDHRAESLYLQDLEQPKPKSSHGMSNGVAASSSQTASTGQNMLSSVLADTWSDDDED